jgi:hypothetical protein
MTGTVKTIDYLKALRTVHEFHWHRHEILPLFKATDRELALLAEISDVDDSWRGDLRGIKVANYMRYSEPWMCGRIFMHCLEEFDSRRCENHRKDGVSYYSMSNYPHDGHSPDLLEYMKPFERFHTLYTEHPELIWPELTTIVIGNSIILLTDTLVIEQDL